MFSSIFMVGLLQFLKSAILIVGYITGSSLFPEPLTPEEEKIALEKFARRR